MTWWPARLSGFELSPPHKCDETTAIVGHHHSFLRPEYSILTRRKDASPPGDAHPTGGFARSLSRKRAGRRQFCDPFLERSFFKGICFNARWIGQMKGSEGG